MSSKFGQIRSVTTEFAALEHLKNQCCPFFSFHSVVLPGKKSGERLQDHWSSGYCVCGTVSSIMSGLETRSLGLNTLSTT